MRTLRATLTTASVAAAVGLGACGSGGGSAPPAAAPSSNVAASSEASTSAAPSTSAAAAASGTMDAANQEGDGKSVVVAAVNLDAAGKERVDRPAC